MDRHRFSARVLLVVALLPLIVGCHQTRQTAPAGETSSIPSPTIARQILDIESPVAGHDPARIRLLDDILEQAARRIGAITPPTHSAPGENPQRVYALQVFRTIDALLIERHFVYPVHGQIDTLSCGLTPRAVTTVQAAELKTQPNNFRRSAAIDANGGRSFCFVDCGVASLLYLAIGEKLHLPISLVAVPTHMFVRWDYPPLFAVPGGHVDFETNLGIDYTDPVYARNYGVSDAEIERGVYLSPLSHTEVLGYRYGVRGEMRARRGDYAGALADLRTACSMAPCCFELKNLLAWELATCPQADHRNGVEAVEVGLQLLQLDRCANGLDTLAAAYAESGDFDRALETESQARDMAFSSSPGRTVNLDYQARLAAYHGHITYAQRQAGGAEPTAKSVGVK